MRPSMVLAPVDMTEQAEKDRVIFGRVADQVVKNAECPVLTINPYRGCLPCGPEAMGGGLVNASRSPH